MSFGDRLIKVRKEHGYTREALAQKLDISKFTLRNYELGATEPGHTFLKQISDFFHVSVDYLMELTDEQEMLEAFRIRASERNLIEKYRSLDPYGQETVNIILDREISRTEQIRDASSQAPTISRIYTYMHKIAAAGVGFYFDDIPTETIEAPYRKNADFIIGVNGDSMEPTYSDGDLVYVEKCQVVEIGEIGIFIVNGECFIKEAGKDGLISHNSKYDIIPGSEYINCVGKVLGKVQI